ncbi:MAG: DUF3109 family protein [Phycisphaerae bacterium]
MTREWIQIGGIWFDARTLAEIAHRCEPCDCSAKGRCCASYEVTLTQAEADQLAGMIPAVLRAAPRLQERESIVNPFEEVDDGLLAIDTDEEGVCVFAAAAPGGELLCSLHATAIQLGLNPAHCKPRSCWLWPLATFEDSGKVYVSVMEDAYSFACNHRRRGKRDRLDDGIAEIIGGLFGAEVLEGLNDHLADMPDPRLR